MQKFTSSYAIFTLLSLFFLASSVGVLAQANPNLSLEKIYTQTDRPLYFPGETIWFKASVVDEANQVSSKSDFLYVELIAPNGAVVQNLKLGIQEGYAYGDFTIPRTWVGGIYQLKMYTNWMRNFGKDGTFSKEITIQKVVKPRLLMKLEFEQEGYGPNAKVLANFKVDNLKNIPLRQTTFRYTLAVAGKKILEEKAQTDQVGKHQIAFTLPENLSTRDVVLNVKISYQGNTESVSRSVPVVLDNIDLQFFPESGKAIAGARNRIAFKAIDEFAKPVDVEGIITKEDGSTVTTFKSFHDGMGSFDLLATAGTQYYAQIQVPFLSKTKIALPSIYEQGVNFRLTTNHSTTQIDLFTPSKQALKLEIAGSEKVLHQQKILPGQGRFTINTSKFPTGITTFRILNKRGQPLAERLVFLNPDQQLKVSIELEKSVYQTRENVDVRILTTDINGKPIPSNLAIAV
ncbi:MAG: MG2 domain-containing protein, partial [Bacteroidota bacterium]